MLAFSLTPGALSRRVSAFLRVLAFSPGRVASVRVRLDGEGDPWLPCAPAGGPLFTCDWRPADYGTGLHTMEVRGYTGPSGELRGGITGVSGGGGGMGRVLTWSMGLVKKEARGR